MKRVLSLILFFAVFALINGPPVYSMNDVDEPISIETTMNLVMVSDVLESNLQPLCTLPGGLELRLPTTEVNIFIEISSQIWICNEIAKDPMMDAIKHFRFNNQSPDANSLAQTTVKMGLTRLDIGESYVYRHIRKTYS